MPLLTVGGIIITPDMPSVLFWGLTGWALAELYASGKANWWLAVGLLPGLACYPNTPTFRRRRHCDLARRPA